jgi:hypothetical protein
MELEYPRWAYQGDKSVLVKNEAEHEALEGEWFDTPTEAAEAANAPDKSDLIAKAAEIGAAIDKRWSFSRISDAIDAEVLKIEAGLKTEFGGA